MNIILLSGGSGKRLWPLSNDVRSKQFIKFFKDEKDEYESMVQRVYRQILAVDEQSNISIATSKTQVSAIKNQIGEETSICVEPGRRDTFPAIALATAYLFSEQGLSLEDTVVICPVDPYVEEDYFEALLELSKFAESNDGNLTLMGVEPTYPSKKYGYIMPVADTHYSKVDSFKEKPTELQAADYIAKGALWNCGVFACKIGYVLEIAKTTLNFTTYEDLYNRYESLEKISFDYAVVEKEKNIEVMRFAGQWKDIGTWNTLVEEMAEDVMGNAVLNETCENTKVMNELDIPILCMGAKNLIVAASSDGILIAEKIESSYIKPYVEKFDQQIMFAEKSWGKYEVLDVEKESMTIKVTLHAGSKMNYHSHDRRDEVWTILSGTGKTVVDGMEESVHAGDIVMMKAGCRHMIMAETELTIMEVQIGKEISVHDKRKYQYFQ